MEIPGFVRLLRQFDIVPVGDALQHLHVALGLALPGRFGLLYGDLIVARVILPVRDTVGPVGCEVSLDFRDHLVLVAQHVDRRAEGADDGELDFHYHRHSFRVEAFLLLVHPGDDFIRRLGNEKGSRQHCCKQAGDGFLEEVHDAGF